MNVQNAIPARMPPLMPCVFGVRRGGLDHEEGKARLASTPGNLPCPKCTQFQQRQARAPTFIMSTTAMTPLKKPSHKVAALSSDPGHEVLGEMGPSVLTPDQKLLPVGGP